MMKLLRDIHRDERGALSVEYMMIMAVVVLPFGLMVPVFYKMTRDYAERVANIIALPFP